MKNLNKRVGEVIRLLREKKGLTQEELSEASGVNDKYIGLIERGKNRITLDYLWKISQGLNISMAELMASIFGAAEDDEHKKTLQDIHLFLLTLSHDDLKIVRKLFLGSRKAPQREKQRH